MWGELHRAPALEPGDRDKKSSLQAETAVGSIQCISLSGDRDRAEPALSALLGESAVAGGADCNQATPSGTSLTLPSITQWSI